MNPADLLFQQLQQWNTHGQQGLHAGRHRGLDSDAMAAIRRHEGALANLRSIGELLDEAKLIDLFPVHAYESELPVWGQMILSFPGGWAPTGAFDPNSLRLLGTLGPQLRPLVPKLVDGSADKFEKALDDVLGALKSDPSIPNDVARYLLNLILHMRLVIEEYRLDIRGDYDLARAATLLRTTIETAYTNTTDEESKTRWGKLREVFSLQNAVSLAIQWSTVWPTLMLPPGTGA